MDDHPDPYIHLPSGKHTHTLILLHGTSQTGPLFAEAFLPFQFSYPTSTTATITTLPDLLPTVKFIFPTGSLKRTTVFDGAQTHAWFDIHDFADRTKGEEDQIIGMKESAAFLLSLIRRENQILENEGEREGRVGLLGFSQGCAMGVLMVLSGVLDLNGKEEREEGRNEGKANERGGGGVNPFVGMSGWLPFRAQIENVLDNEGDAREYLRGLLDLNPSPAQARPARDIFLGHGADDVKVRLEWAKQMMDIVPRILDPRNDGEVRVTSNMLDGLAHWWNEEELVSLVRFLRATWILE